MAGALAGRRPAVPQHVEALLLRLFPAATSISAALPTPGASSSRRRVGRVKGLRGQGRRCASRRVAFPRTAQSCSAPPPCSAPLPCVCPPVFVPLCRPRSTPLPSSLPLCRRPGHHLHHPAAPRRLCRRRRRRRRRHRAALAAQRAPGGRRVQLAAGGAAQRRLAAPHARAGAPTGGAAARAAGRCRARLPPGHAQARPRCCWRRRVRRRRRCCCSGWTPCGAGGAGARFCGGASRQLLGQLLGTLSPRPCPLAALLRATVHALRGAPGAAPTDTHPPTLSLPSIISPEHLTSCVNCIPLYCPLW